MIRQGEALDAQVPGVSSVEDAGDTPSIVPMVRWILLSRIGCLCRSRNGGFPGKTWTIYLTHYASRDAWSEPSGGRIIQWGQCGECYDPSSLTKLSGRDATRRPDAPFWIHNDPARLASRP